MKHPILRPAVASMLAIALILVVSACGGKQTVASKSAAAFRDTQQKGTPPGGDSHGGHSASGDSTMPAADHSTMTGGGGTDTAGMDHSKMQNGQSTAGMDHSQMQSGQSMAGMDHSKMQNGQSMAGMDHSKMKSGQSMAGMDHSKMQSGQSMAGMDHSKMQSGQSMAGMDHSKMQSGQSMAGMDHSKMGMPGMGDPTSMTPPITNTQIQQIEPASTLKVDPFDAPSGIAVAEAARSVAGGGGDAGIPMQQGEENTPAASPTPAMDHSQHGGSAPAAAAATAPRTKPPTTSTNKSAPVVATVYACPMHPEVRSGKPAKCPKCGMALVKKK